MNGLDYETLLTLRRQCPNIFNCVTQEFSNGDATFDETKLSNGENVITRDRTTQIACPTNINEWINNIKTLTLKTGEEIPFYLIGYKQADCSKGDFIRIARIIIPAEQQLYLADDACSHDWIVPFLEGNVEGLSPEDLKKPNVELCIFQCHTHPENKPGSNVWSVRDLSSIRFMQTEMNLPVTHSLLVTPNAGIRILDVDFKNMQTIKSLENQMMVTPAFEGYKDTVTAKKDFNGNTIMRKTSEEEYIPVPEFRFEQDKSLEIIH